MSLPGVSASMFEAEEAASPAVRRFPFDPRRRRMSRHRRTPGDRAGRAGGGLRALRRRSAMRQPAMSRMAERGSARGGDRRPRS